MNLRNIRSIINKEFLDIRSFIIVFSLYSMISIGFAYHIEKLDRQLNNLSQEVKVLKVNYVNCKTSLMSLNKHSALLEKGEFFDLYPSNVPVKIIEFEI